MKLKLTRHPKNPLLKPSENWWENKAVFNPGATIFNDKIVLLYRAIGDDNISRLGLAKSSDGLQFERFKTPIYDSPIDDPYERLGCEDPRITKIGDEYYILYTAASVYSTTSRHPKTEKISVSKSAPFRIRAGLAKTRDFQTIKYISHLFGDLDTKNAAIFPEKFNDQFYILHRVYPNLSLSTSPDCIKCHHDTIIAKPRPGKWDSLKIGAGAQPIKTPYGWLLFYHGTNQKNRYHLGIMVLDLKNPRKVIYRSPEPILSPEKDYEKSGDVQNVVFTCGAVEWNDKYFVYYGAADKVIGLATIPLEDVFKEISGT